MVDRFTGCLLGSPVAEAGWHGPKVGSRLALCCIHRVN